MVAVHIQAMHSAIAKAVASNLSSHAFFKGLKMSVRRIRCSMILCGAAIISAGCASGGGVPFPFAQGVEGKALKRPFIESAIDRVKGHYQRLPGRLVPVSETSTDNMVRSFSGQPSYKSVEAIEKIRESGGIVDAPASQQYLQAVLDRLLRHWPYETPRIGVFITSSNSYGAFATIDGDILISARTLLTLESEDEIAAILAHEAGHVLMRHHERSASQKQTKKLANFAFSTAMRVFMIANSESKRIAPGSYRVSISNNKGLQTQSLQTAGICLATRYFIDKLFDPGWNRVQEDEADLLAIDLLHRAGYDVRGALITLKHQRDYEGDIAKQWKVAKRRREGTYDKIVQASVKRNGIAGFFTGAATAITQGVVNTFQDLDKAISQSHRLTEDRIKNVKQYVAHHYGERLRHELERRRYAKLFGNSRTREYLERHEFAFKAFEFWQDGKTEEAYDAARQAVQKPAHRAAPTRFVMYLVLVNMGRPEEAYEQLLQIENLRGAPAEVLLTLADEHYRRNRIAEADEAMRYAYRLAGIDDGAGAYDPHRRRKKTAAESISDLLGFKVDGPCDAVNKRMGELIGVLGGDRVARRRQTAPQAYGRARGRLETEVSSRQTSW